MKCGCVMPNHEIELTPENEDLSCVLEENHLGDHLAKLANGFYVLWNLDIENDVEDFPWQEISLSQAQMILRNYGEENPLSSRT